ncbi:hypothetical protein HDU92_007761 [Lobulomyces angularis]|nr:hypothetical protein HDU92_007761 [Lobulomyces angularis]
MSTREESRKAYINALNYINNKCNGTKKVILFNDNGSKVVFSKWTKQVKKDESKGPPPYIYRSIYYNDPNNERTRCIMNTINKDIDINELLEGHIDAALTRFTITITPPKEDGGKVRAVITLKAKTSTNNDKTGKNMYNVIKNYYDFASKIKKQMFKDGKLQQKIIDDIKNKRIVSTDEGDEHIAYDGYDDFNDKYHIYGDKRFFVTGIKQPYTNSKDMVFDRNDEFNDPKSIDVHIPIFMNTENDDGKPYYVLPKNIYDLPYDSVLVNGVSSTYIKDIGCEEDYNFEYRKKDALLKKGFDNRDGPDEFGIVTYEGIGIPFVSLKSIRLNPTTKSINETSFSEGTTEFVLGLEKLFVLSIDKLPPQRLKARKDSALIKKMKEIRLLDALLLILKLNSACEILVNNSCHEIYTKTYMVNNIGYSGYSAMHVTDKYLFLPIIGGISQINIASNTVVKQFIIEDSYSVDYIKSSGDILFTTNRNGESVTWNITSGNIITSFNDGFSNYGYDLTRAFIYNKTVTVIYDGKYSRSRNAINGKSISSYTSMMFTSSEIYHKDYIFAVLENKYLGRLNNNEGYLEYYLEYNDYYEEEGNLKNIKGINIYKDSLYVQIEDYIRIMDLTTKKHKVINNRKTYYNDKSITYKDYIYGINGNTIVKQSILDGSYIVYELKSVPLSVFSVNNYIYVSMKDSVLEWNMDEVSITQVAYTNNITITVTKTIAETTTIRNTITSTIAKTTIKSTITKNITLPIITTFTTITNNVTLPQVTVTLVEQCDTKNSDKINSNTKNYTSNGSIINSLVVNNTLLYVGHNDGIIKRWDIESGKNLTNYIISNTSVNAITVDNDSIYAAYSDKLIRKWNVSTNKVVKTYIGHNASITSLFMDKEFIYSGSIDKVIKQWNTATGKNTRNFTGHTGTIYSLYINNGILYSGSADKTVKVWNTTSGAYIKEFSGHSSVVNTLTKFNGLLYSGSYDKTIKEWSLTTGKNTRNFTGHSSYILSIFAVNGFLYSGSDDKTIKRWNLTNGANTYNYTGHSAAVNSVYINNNLLYSGSSNGEIKQWQL